MFRALRALGLLMLLAGAAGAEPRADAALADYVATADTDYAWSLRQTTRVGANPVTELRLVSQHWHGHEWRHQLWLFEPAEAAEPASHALLFVAGGSWQAAYDDPDHRAEPPPDAPLYAALAEQLGAPVAVLRQVPFQPIGGMVEDQLIAFTFNRYLQQPDDYSRPLLLPMVNSAVRAMDAVQEFAAAEWGQAIDSFTVTGASKRGWTAWLTAAVDTRVTALAPMVFDMLDIEAQVRHQEAVWGALSPRLADYVEYGLPEVLDTEAGQRLLSMVDPYRQLTQLTQPKLIILGSNDDFWPLDAVTIYWDDLPGPRHLLLLPNQGHSVTDYDRILPAMHALHQHVAHAAPLPELDWEYAEDPAGVTLTVRAAPAPEQARLWVARADERDFRNARWEAQTMARFEDGHQLSVPRPETGYVAVFGELGFRQPNGQRLRLSTTPKVISYERPREAAAH